MQRNVSVSSASAVFYFLFCEFHGDFVLSRETNLHINEKINGTGSQEKIPRRCVLLKNISGCYQVKLDEKFLLLCFLGLKMLINLRKIFN